MLAWLQRQRNRALILGGQSLHVTFGQGILLLEGSLAALKELLLACPCSGVHRKQTLLCQMRCQLHRLRKVWQVQ